MAEPLSNRYDLPVVDVSGQIESTLYLSSCAVDPAHRGRGIGRALRESRIQIGRTLGYTRFTTHMRAGSAAKIGARVLDHCGNWFDCGPFEYLELS